MTQRVRTVRRMWTLGKPQLPSFSRRGQLCQDGRRNSVSGELSENESSPERTVAESVIQRVADLMAHMKHLT